MDGRVGVYNKLWFSYGRCDIYHSVASSAQEIESIRVPVVDKKSPRGISTEVFPILHPHRILSYLFDSVQLELDTGSIHEFWDHSRSMGEPWAVASPASRDHVPIGLHGDAARLWTVYQFEKQLSITLNLPLFRPRSTRYSRYVVFSIPYHKVLTNRTLNVVWRRLVWSMNAAYTGVNPVAGVGGAPLQGSDVERAGKPITSQGLRFTLTEVRGDWEFHRDCWRPTVSWQSMKEMCMTCPARATGPSGTLYYNNEADCAWDMADFGLEEFSSKRLKERNLCA